MSAGRGFVRGLGELLLTAGLVVLLFVAYLLWGTSSYTSRSQASLHDDLRRAWAGATPASPARGVSVKPIPVGAGFAVIRIPRLGPDYAKVVVEGVALADLKRGPGHYPGTALPGQVGNAVISGHRTTYGAPFNRLDELRVGDAVVLETQDRWFVYRMSDREIVAPDAISEINPAPHQAAGAPPTQRLLTLTTCHPKYSAAQRLIVHATFTRAVPKAQPPPVELGGP